MQFTDLIDKNGKEIWEGDVVVDTPEKAKPWVVEWYVEGWNFDESGEYGSESKNVEVIGNIYENPELLKP